MHNFLCLSHNEIVYSTDSVLFISSCICLTCLVFSKYQLVWIFSRYYEHLFCLFGVDKNWLLRYRKPIRATSSSYFFLGSSKFCSLFYFCLWLYFALFEFIIVIFICFTLTFGQLHFTIVITYGQLLIFLSCFVQIHLILFYPVCIKTQKKFVELVGNM